MAHFKQIIIEKFRGFDSLEVLNLGQINLFVGKNNCGKSSILESIFLSAGMSNPSLPAHINSFRGLDKSVNDLKFIFNKLQFDKIPVFTTLTDEDIERRLEIHPIFKQNISNENSENVQKNDLYLMNTSTATPTISGVDLVFMKKQKHSKAQKGKSRFYSEDEQHIRINQEKRYQEKLQAVFISSDSKERNALPRFSEIVKKKKEKIKDRQRNFLENEHWQLSSSKLQPLKHFLNKYFNVMFNAHKQKSQI